ncbi:MAG: hypothetical protein Q8K26_05450 [Candidatus Gracilibacteria bacterium]|nr:hypothetical protein [Candidatus Gracilibacteria bacterium]
MNTTNGYDTEEAQNALAGLPKDDRELLHMIHREEAETINDAKKAKIDAILGIETSESSEIAEIHLDEEDYGRPPENFGIEIVTDGRPFSDQKPQCAENPDYPGEWKYNHPGMIQLAEKLGRKLPTEQQLLTHINAIPRNAVAKAQAMTPNGEIFPGYRDAGDGNVYGRGDIVYWWVASFGSSARCVYLGRGDQYAGSDSGDCRFGFSVRFLSKNK